MKEGGPRPGRGGLVRLGLVALGLALGSVGGGLLAAQEGGGPGSAMAAPSVTVVYTGIASWYGAEFQGRPTASGEVYDPEAYTAAHPSLPFGTILIVRNLDNGSSVMVKVNDRGPFVPGRALDLSEAAARILGLTVSGTARVSFQALGPAEAAAYGKPAPAPGQASSGPVPSPPGQVGGGGAASSLASGSSAAAQATCRIQVASFRDPRNAQATLDRLRASGIAASLEPSPPYTRVVLNAVPLAEAEALAARLRALGYRDLILTRP